VGEQARGKKPRNAAWDMEKVWKVWRTEDEGGGAIMRGEESKREKTRGQHK
jgi:hypothetical protein